jgi:hypothetical protein
MPEAVLTEKELWGLTDAVVAAADVDFNLLEKGIAVAEDEEGVDWRRGTEEEDRVLLERSVDLDVLLAGVVLPTLVGTCDLKVELDRAVLLLVLLDSLGAGIEEDLAKVGVGIEEDFALGAGEEKVLAKGAGIEEGPLLEFIVGELVTLVPLLTVLVGALDFTFFALILSDNSFARARARALDSNALLLTGELVDHIFFFVV